MSTATLPEVQEGYFPHWKLNTTGLIMPDERLPWGQTIISGLQHGSRWQAGRLSRRLSWVLIQPGTALFGRWHSDFLRSCRRTCAELLGLASRSPPPSLLQAVIPAMGQTHTSMSRWAGSIAAGVLYGITALIVMHSGVGWIERLMPPVVTGAVVAAIGLNLAPVGERRSIRYLDWAAHGSDHWVDFRRGAGIVAQIADRFQSHRWISAVFAAGEWVRIATAHRLYGVGRGTMDRFAEIHGPELPR
jgi:hypothetical protein